MFSKNCKGVDCQNNNKNDMRLFHDCEMKIKYPNGPWADLGKILLYRECVRNLDLRVQVHPGELWV